MYKRNIHKKCLTKTVLHCCNKASLFKTGKSIRNTVFNNTYLLYTEDYK